MNTNVQTEQQPTSYGLREVLNTTTCHDNAKGIVISNETRTLIECRARLSDIYNDVTEVGRLYFGDCPQTDNLLEPFADSFFNTDRALLDLIKDIMADTMLNDDYRQA